MRALSSSGSQIAGPWIGLICETLIGRRGCLVLGGHLSLARFPIFRIPSGMMDPRISGIGVHHASIISYLESSGQLPSTPWMRFVAPLSRDGLSPVRTACGVPQSDGEARRFFRPSFWVFPVPYTAPGVLGVPQEATLAGRTACGPEERSFNPRFIATSYFPAAP